ncbi:pantoate--beta-alanine ligase [Sulfobacillus sp. DSM 109850]|uniref:Pantothenate synthetase n=1 Tax=Sulfobacillus harzensis TaxID=2729629 RepID=A0A7Y0Q1T5_9FIRM|nr:pantoate--beta-alanine ligase [Sulfobacillus harzensis]NMP22443.1 pantoate--beta-alanine ligase [Sulfobacillus harzensis]
MDNIEEARAWARRQRSRGDSVALVPTMGALHRGHLALVEEAQRRVERVVVSIFVNPLQFGPMEDLARYPRTWEQDWERLASLGTDAVFAPSVDVMYPNGPALTRVNVEPLSGVLCGRTRPTHFQGVATVVSKLFNILQPDVAVFGEKDWQQLAIIRRMVDDLNFPVSVVGVPTVREESGLALSSRNQYLTDDQKTQATALYRGLATARDRYRAGERRREPLRQIVLDVLSGAGIEPEYVELVHPDTLAPAPDILDGPTLLALAARLGKARLIDNVILGRS